MVPGSSFGRSATAVPVRSPHNNTIFIEKRQGEMVSHGRWGGGGISQNEFRNRLTRSNLQIEPRHSHPPLDLHQ